MSGVRALEAADIPAVASMFQQLLRKKPGAPPASLADYMRRFYLDAPGCGEGINPLVHVNDAGHVSGFIGVHVLPMTFNGQKLRAGVCGSLMSIDKEKDPLAGARLLKAFLDGPQDLSFSETASDVSTQLWTRLRGVVLPQYSLDWVRIIRPAGFALGFAADRIGLAEAFRPLAMAADNLWRGRMRPGERNWTALPPDGTGQRAGKTSEISGTEFIDLLEPLSRQFALRPDWEECQLDWLLADAVQKPDLGDLVFAAVSAPTGARIGAFAYYARTGRIGRVLQILALPGQAGSVIDCLIDDAAARGLTGLRGRVQPALLEAMLLRRCAFVPVASTVVHSRNAELMKAMTDNQVFLNGLAGEQWSRLIRGHFT